MRRHLVETCPPCLMSVSGFVVYWLLKKTVGIRLSDEKEFAGADLSIHNINAYPESQVK